jgi:hypothetical protein
VNSAKHLIEGLAGPIHSANDVDADQNPAGGNTRGVGFTIVWQDGPRGTDTPGILAPANGAFVEDVLAAVADRLEFFQASEYACAENASALSFVLAAMQVLDQRRDRRRAAGIEGHHATDRTEGNGAVIDPESFIGMRAKRPGE